MSAIKQAYVMYKGQKVVATYNESTKLYSAEIPSGEESSWGETNHKFGAEIHAIDAAGNESVMTSADTTYGDQLNFRVLEKTKPTAKIVSPTQGSVLGASTQNIVMELSDAGGSGLNMSSVVFKVNNKAVTGLTWTDESGKKKCTYSAKGLSDGSNTVTLQVTDNDGNVSAVASVTFVISTAAPTLNVTSPVNDLLTNSNKVTVAGVAAAGSDAVTLAGVTVNGKAVTVASDGKFSTELANLPDGENTVTIVAKDSLGKTTTVVRTVIVDTKAPVISDVVADATTVIANSTIRITFKVIDPE